MATDEMPDWWPSGADQELVRECNCEHCRELVRRLGNPTTTGEEVQPSLNAFGGGAGD